MPNSHHSLATLSFATGSKGGNISLWCPPNSKNATDCNSEGRERADELLIYMDYNDTPFLLGHVIAAIIAGGAYGPLEVGFCQRIAERALSAEIPLPQPAPRPRLELVVSKS